MTKLSKIKEKDIEILFHMKRKGSLTRKESDYGGFQYYMSTSRLKDLDLIKTKSVNESNQKIWVLTKKGESVADCFFEINRLLMGESSEG